MRARGCWSDRVKRMQTFGETLGYPQGFADSARAKTVDIIRGVLPLSPTGPARSL
jgi:hypothetical protein